MRQASTVQQSANCFFLLKSLFAATGPKFTKEFLPLLSSFLEGTRNPSNALTWLGLNTLQESAHPLHLRELFVELSLSVPVKLSALIPCLRLLIKPLILALEGSSDLVGLPVLIQINFFSASMGFVFLSSVLQSWEKIFWSHFLLQSSLVWCVLCGNIWDHLLTNMLLKSYASLEEWLVETEISSILSRN